LFLLIFSFDVAGYSAVFTQSIYKSVNQPICKSISQSVNFRINSQMCKQLKIGLDREHKEVHT